MEFIERLWDNTAHDNNKNEMNNQVALASAQTTSLVQDLSEEISLYNNFGFSNNQHSTTEQQNVCLTNIEISSFMNKIDRQEKIADLYLQEQIALRDQITIKQNKEDELFNKIKLLETQIQDNQEDLDEKDRDIIKLKQTIFNNEILKTKKDQIENSLLDKQSKFLNEIDKQNLLIQNQHNIIEILKVQLYDDGCGNDYDGQLLKLKENKIVEDQHRLIQQLQAQLEDSEEQAHEEIRQKKKAEAQTEKLLKIIRDNATSGKNYNNCGFWSDTDTCSSRNTEFQDDSDKSERSRKMKIILNNFNK